MSKCRFSDFIFSKYKFYFDAFTPLSSVRHRHSSSYYIFVLFKTIIIFFIKRKKHLSNKRRMKEYTNLMAAVHMKWMHIIVRRVKYFLASIIPHTQIPEIWVTNLKINVSIQFSGFSLRLFVKPPDKARIEK